MSSYPFTSADYNLKPEPPTPQQKALSQAVAEADWNGGNLLPWLQNVLMVTEPNAQGIDVSDHFVTLGGPSALPTAFWTPRDHTAPSVPASISFTAGASGGNDVTPKQMAVTVTVDVESLLRVRSFGTIADGSAAFGDSTPASFDPSVAAWLGLGITFEMGRVFSASSNSNTDPVHAIGTYAGIGQRTVGSLIFADLLDGYASIIADGRFQPTVAWASPAAYKALLLETTATGAYRHEIGEPLILDTLVNADGSVTPVPILPLRGMPGTQAIIADGKSIVAVHREAAAGLLVRVDRTDQLHFDKDQADFRLIRRIDFGIIPGHEPGVMRILQ